MLEICGVGMEWDVLVVGLRLDWRRTEWGTEGDAETGRVRGWMQWSGRVVAGLVCCMFDGLAWSGFRL